MPRADALKPGDTYAAADKIEHTVAEVWSLAHVTTVVHTDGTERKLFVATLVQVLT